jgi:hypothetical protein
MTSKKKWHTPELPELVGNKEACEILGIDKMTLNRWKEPGSGEVLDFDGFGPNRTYMCTWAEIASGPVWVREDVIRHRDEIGRQRAPSARFNVEDYRIQRL